MSDDDTRPPEGKLHDRIVTVGGEDAQLLAHDWYQHTARQEPCPVCVVIKDALATAVRDAKLDVWREVQRIIGERVDLSILESDAVSVKRQGHSGSYEDMVLALDALIREAGGAS